MNKLDNIIKKNINSYLNENIYRKKISLDETISEVLKDYYNSNTQKSGGKTNKKNNVRYKKGSNGKKIAYDYDQSLKNDPHIPDSDAASLRNKVDDEYLNTAALARSVFPDHTPEGAQSHLRKVLNGERPMTKKVEKKISHKIAAGELPTN